MSNVIPWPPAVPAGTTAQTELIGGGSGLPIRKGGGDTNTCVNPQYAVDKATDSSDRWLIVRWSDDRTGAWSKEHTLSLAKIGPSPMVLRIHALGGYKSRQWEIISQSAVPLVVLAAEEEVEPLGKL